MMSSAPWSSSHAWRGTPHRGISLVQQNRRTKYNVTSAEINARGITSYLGIGPFPFIVKETFQFGNGWFHNTYQYLYTDTRSHIFAQPWSVVIGVPEKWESGVKHKFRMRQICSYLRSEINAMEHCFACHVLRGYVVTTLKELEFEFLKPPHGGPEHCYNTTILYPSKRSMEKILPSCHNPVRFSKKIDMNLHKPWTLAE